VAKNARTAAGEQGEWQRDTISYEVFYGDYGGRANVDFYSRAREGKTVVFVFMYARDHADKINQGPHADTINRILESVNQEKALNCSEAPPGTTAGTRRPKSRSLPVHCAVAGNGGYEPC
jgi:hypothetical protein